MASALCLRSTGQSERLYEIFIKTGSVSTSNLYGTSGTYCLSDVTAGQKFSAYAATVQARSARKEQPMLDLVMLAIGLGFFALTVGYAVVCDRL